MCTCQCRQKKSRSGIIVGPMDSGESIALCRARMFFAIREREISFCLLVLLWVSTISSMGCDDHQHDQSLISYIPRRTLADCAVCSAGFGRGAGNECHQCTGSFKGVMYFLLALAALVTLLLMTLLAIYLVRRVSKTKKGVLV